MANSGKFIDRERFVSTAGKAYDLEPGVGSLLKSFTNQDYLENVHAAEIKYYLKQKSCTSKPIKLNSNSIGVADLISPPAKTIFQDFYDRVYESRYESYKNRPLAKSRQCLSKPETITNDNHTFGDKSNLGEPVYGLVLPRKIPFQVICEAEEGHDNYIVSHQHYFPGEQVKRKYKTPFDSSFTYGMKTNVEPGGKLVHRALEDLWCPDYLCIMNKAQRDYLERYKSQLGKPLQPNQINNKLPADFTFGISTASDRYTSEELIYQRDPYDFKSKLLKGISYLNRLRTGIMKRKGYDMEDMRLEAEEIDAEFTGTLSLKALLCIMRDHSLEIEEDNLRTLLGHFKMLQEDDHVKFKDFMNLLDSRHSIPDVGRLDDIFVPDAHQLTTYRNLTETSFTKDSKCIMEPAGMPSVNMERHYPRIPSDTVRADMECLPEETDVRGILMPSIPSLFGLSHRDYYLPRNREEIRAIFSNIGFVDLEDDGKFQEIWNEASNHWTSKDDQVSVEAFRHVLKSKQTKKE